MIPRTLTGAIATTAPVDEFHRSLTNRPTSVSSKYKLVGLQVDVVFIIMSQAKPSRVGNWNIPHAQNVLFVLLPLPPAASSHPQRRSDSSTTRLHLESERHAAAAQRIGRKRFTCTIAHPLARSLVVGGLVQFFHRRCNDRIIARIL